MLASLRSLVAGSLRTIVSRYPSNATPDLRAAWKQPLVKWSATPQPYTAPLTIPNGNAKLTGETLEMRREYREWSFREPPVKAALLTKCLAVASLEPQLTPDNKKDERDRDAARYVDWAITRAAGGWGGLIQNLLLPATIDGFSVLEPVYDEVDRSHGQYSGFWTVKRFAMLETEQLRFRMDEFRQVVGVRPMTGLTGYIEIPPETVLIFTHLKMFENPFGISDLRAVVRDCRMIEEIVKLRHTCLVNWSGPFLKATAGDMAAQRQLLSILKQARAGGFIVLPAGCELEIMNLATSSASVFDAALAWHREQVVSAIQGSYLQLLASDGERGNSLVAKNVSELFTWWLALWVCEVINFQLIPNIVRPNFGNAVGYPRLSLGGINEAAVTAALDRFKRLQDMGVKLSEEQVTTVGGAEIPKDEADILKPPTQQQQQQGQQGQQGGSQDPFGSLFNDPSRAHVGTGNVTPQPQALFAEWKAYINPDDGRSGWISPGGVVRYEKPASADQQSGSQGSEHTSERSAASKDAEDMAKDIAAAFPAEAAKPGFMDKLKDKLAGAMASAYIGAGRLVTAIGAAKEAYEAVFDTPDDITKKMGYNPSYTQSPSAGSQDAFREMTGLSTHFAVTVASKVLPKAINFLKAKLGGGATKNDDADATRAMAEWMAELFNSISGQQAANVDAIEAKLREILATKMSEGGALPRSSFRRYNPSR